MIILKSLGTRIRVESQIIKILDIFLSKNFKINFLYSLSTLSLLDDFLATSIIITQVLITIQRN